MVTLERPKLRWYVKGFTDDGQIILGNPWAARPGGVVMTGWLRRLAAGTVLAAAVATLTACSENTPPGGDVDSGDCVGDQSGDTTVAASYPSPLPGGGEAGIGTVEADQDPPLLNIVLGGDASKNERDGATELTVGDTFTVRKTTYTVAGFCEDKAWLDEAAS